MDWNQTSAELAAVEATVSTKSIEPTAHAVVAATCANTAEKARLQGLQWKWNLLTQQATA